MIQSEEVVSSSKELSLAALSRNASVISTSSSDSAGTSSVLATPRPRPVRTFSSPRSASPKSKSPRSSRPPPYLAKELGLPDDPKLNPPTSRSKSRGRNGAVGPDDFSFGAILGEGSYSTVKLATHIRTGQQYAVKVLDKVHLIRKDKMNTALDEKNALVALGTGHPGVVRLFYSFQDEWCLYFVIDLVKGGEMQTRISRMGSLSTQCTRYYAAQIIDTIHYMHDKMVIHRDLKPENLLLDENRRIKIIDFGTAKIIKTPNQRTRTWVGTAQYVAPELLESNETGRGSDFWSLGCIIYQMMSGRFAFHGLSDFLIYQKIKRLDYTFPEGFDSSAKDLVEKLLVRDPDQRLGVGEPGTPNDYKALQSHPFFATVNWDTLWTDPAPPLEPGLVKKDPPKGASNWEDVGAAWDKLVGAEMSDEDDDEIPWAADARIPPLEVTRPTANGSITPTNTTLENGIPHIADKVNENSTMLSVAPPRTPEVSHTPRNSLTPSAENAVLATGPGQRDSSQSGSSSSEGSPVDKLSREMDRVKVSRSTPTSIIMEEEEERGRNQAMSPVQGNGLPGNINIGVRLGLPQGEVVLFTSTVEARSLRRRASRLIPLPVPPSRTKTRQLVLTNQRLICLKQLNKSPANVSVKSELALRASSKLREKDKEKESRGIIASVERKGEREFMVLTSTKTYGYAAPDTATADTWVQQIDAALASHGRKPSQART